MQATPERILPDGCVEIVLNFAARFQEINEHAERKIQPRHFLVGQMTRPILIAPTGSVQLIGIRFHPGGTFPFFRLSMHQTTNRVIELGAICNDLERELVAAAGDTPSLRMKIEALERVLVRRARRCQHDSKLIEMTAKIVRVAGKVAVDTLAADAGLSARQLRRRFLLEVGVGPKLLCRLLRFQQIFKAVDRGEAEWADVAVDCGYYDQAHLINDFRQFAHETPGVLLADSSVLTDAFTRKKRPSDFSNTPAVIRF